MSTTVHLQDFTEIYSHNGMNAKDTLLRMQKDYVYGGHAEDHKRFRAHAK